MPGRGISVFITWPSLTPPARKCFTSSPPLSCCHFAWPEHLFHPLASQHSLSAQNEPAQVPQSTSAHSYLMNCASMVLFNWRLIAVSAQSASGASVRFCPGNNISWLVSDRKQMCGYVTCGILISLLSFSFWDILHVLSQVVSWSKDVVYACNFWWKILPVVLFHFLTQQRLMCVYCVFNYIKSLFSSQWGIFSLTNPISSAFITVSICSGVANKRLVSQANLCVLSKKR